MKRLLLLICGLSLVTGPAAQYTCPNGWIQTHCHTASLQEPFGMATYGNDVFIAGSVGGIPQFGPVVSNSTQGMDPFLVKFRSDGSVDWLRQEGGPGHDNGTDVATDSQGNVYFTGRYESGATFGGMTVGSYGGYDIFLAKYDNQGNFLWVKYAGGIGNEFSYGVDVDGDDNVYITGYFEDQAFFDSLSVGAPGMSNTDNFLAKYSPSGNLLWLVSEGGPFLDRSFGIAVEGNAVYLTGEHTNVSGIGLDIAHVVKFDTSGTFQWKKNLPATDVAIGYAITGDGAGGFYTVGDFYVDIVWGGYNLISGGQMDMYVAHCDSNGATLWAKRYGGSTADGGRGITLTGNGQKLYVAGMRDGLVLPTTWADPWILEIDASNGNLIHEEYSSGPGSSAALAITSDLCGNVYTSGRFYDSLTLAGYFLDDSLGGDLFLWKLCEYPSSISANFGWTAQGQSLSLTDSSAGAISWHWGFGDGNSSTLQNPTHFFQLPGSYSVCLIAEDYCGSDTLCQTVTVSCSPTYAGFDATHQDLTIQFTDTSTPNVTSWLWDFGDGSTSTQQHPAHYYTWPGSYWVCLYVSGPCGTDSICDSLMVTCPAPIAGFSWMVNGWDVQFTDLSPNVPTAWFWNFGDGGSAFVQNPLHQYGATGYYNVCLIAQNICGSDTLCDTVAVGCPPPVAGFGWTASGLNVTFSDNSLGPPLQWHWDFGDGDTSALAQPTHSYAQGGTYLVTLIVTNSCGSDTLQDSINVIGTVVPGGISEKIQLWPNPTTSTFFLNGLPDSPVEISLYDLRGKLMQTWNSRGQNQMQFDLMPDAKGVYVLKIAGPDFCIHKRIIVR